MDGWIDNWREEHVAAIVASFFLNEKLGVSFVQKYAWALL
jgi:hypothetical protein